MSLVLDGGNTSLGSPVNVVGDLNTFTGEDLVSSSSHLVVVSQVLGGEFFEGKIGEVVQTHGERVSGSVVLVNHLEIELEDIESVVLFGTSVLLSGGELPLFEGSSVVFLVRVRLVGEIYC